MRGKGFLTIFILLPLMVASASCYPVRYDGPYKGKVVDAETRKPIEGVVVLGVWYKDLPSPGGTVGSYFDAHETVTDKNGDFEVKGLGLKILSNVSTMHVLIFKAGYQYIGMGMWESLKLEGGLLEKKVAWEGERAIIPLRKVTMEERKSPPDPPSEALFENVRLMLKEIDRDDIERGLQPRKTWKGKKIE